MNCKTAALALDEPWRIGFIGRPDPAKTPLLGKGRARESSRKKRTTTEAEGYDRGVRGDV